MADRESNTANAFETTLTSDMGDTDLTANVNTTSGGPASPAYLVIDPDDDSKREIIYFDGTFTSTSFETTSLSNRYLEGSAAGSGITHNTGAKVVSVPVSQHWVDVNDRADAIDTDLTNHKASFDTDHGTDHDARNHSTALGTASLADLGTANGADLDDLGTFLSNVEVDGSTEVASASLTTSFQNIAVVNVDIPADWGSWKGEAYATYVIEGDTAVALYDALIRIDGVDQQAQLGVRASDSPPIVGTVGGRHTGLTGTGSRGIALRLRENSGSSSTLSVQDIYLYVRAVRTS